MELCHVERSVFAMHHNLGGSAPHGRGLLQPMTGETIEEKKFSTSICGPKIALLSKVL